MIVRALDFDDDWTFGKGRNNYLSMNPAVAQALKTRIKSFLGDCFFAQQDGIDWFNLLGGKNQLAINLAVKAVILNTPSVVSMNELGVTLDSLRDLHLTYSVNTVFLGTLNGGVGLILTESGDFLITESGDRIHA